MIIRRTRAALAAELDRLAEGFDHQGNDRLARQAMELAANIRKGSSGGKVGHTRYEVEGE